MSRNINHLAGSGVVSNRVHTIDLPRRGRALRFLSAFALVLAVLPSVSAGVFPGQDWQTASPDSQGVNPETLKRTMDYIQANAGGPGAAECVMGGAFYLYAECFEPTLTWGDGAAFRSIDIMHDFFCGMAYWELKPDHDLVNAGSLCLAAPGLRSVICRQRGGMIVLDLAKCQSTPAFAAERLDLRTGATHTAETVTGGRQRSFTCPDSQDWVLHLHL